MGKGKQISLEQSLLAYRVIHTPSQFSWKQHWVKETFRYDNLMDCNEEEQGRFSARLRECPVTFASSIRALNGEVKTLQDLVDTIHNPAFEHVEKERRRVVFSTGNGERPVGDKAFELWNGLQIIDLDIKDRARAAKLKTGLFSRLKKYNWFLGIVFSSSGTGLHIYTKIQVPDEEDFGKRKLLYLTNFRHKFSFVYLACLNFMEECGFDKNDLLYGGGLANTNKKPWLDLAMFRPQQGAFIGYDPKPMFSTHFFEDFIYVNFDNVEDLGHPDVDWVTFPDLREVFKRWEWFEDKEDEDDVNVEVKDAPDREVDTHNKVHYKHFERWRLANTLVRLYGEEKGYRYLRQICSNVIKDKELQSDCTTASRHKKPVDVWAVNQLNNRHGFKIKLNISQQEVDLQELYSSIDNIENPTLIKESIHTKDFHLKKNEYLGNIKHDLLNSIGRITLIEAGAGVGKTEMVKSLITDGKKIVLVMPFTSTIKAKVEKVRGWGYYYGNKKVRLDKDQGVAMTIDKFSKMNLMEIKEMGFEYIFIDESHLMFQSEYRPVMPKVIDMIRNTEVPIILMSGTPVGETVFFDDIVHLRVTKEDVRRKEFNMCICNDPSDVTYFMCRQMAKDISEGRRVLFPSNKGTLYKEQIRAAVQFILEREFQDTNPLIINYYKKANVGEDFMNDINFEKTIKNTQILMCSNYLSVGVDILDRFQFSIYFNDLWMPQEMEQFANRLRSNDLYIYLYISKNDADGNSRGITKYSPLDLRLNDDEIKDCHSIVQMCNRMIERNPVEYKYNSLIASIIQNNKFIEYNEVENKYYLNEIAFKTVFFERKYREFVQQLPVVAKGMQAYGYTYRSEDFGSFSMKDPDDMKELTAAMSGARGAQTELDTAMIDELMEMITEDRLSIYKDAHDGRYDIRKGKEWKEDPVNMIMWARNVEVFERVVPIFASMSKLFVVDDIKDIFHSCMNTNGSYNFAAIRRIRMLINMLYNSSKNRLDIPIQEFMEKAYAFSEKGRCNRADLIKFINDFSSDYAHKESTDKVFIWLSPITMKTIQTTFMDIFKSLVEVSRPKGDGTITMKRVELLWQTREHRNTTTGANENMYILQEFFDSIHVEEDITAN